jgi:hypothetical protein
VRKAIATKLGAVHTPLIERRAGGHVAVPAHHLRRLGDGRFDLGRHFMHRLIKQIRARRARSLKKGQ